MAAGDETFLRSVYASTRAEELSLTDWDEATRAAFVESQFLAQDHHYRTNYPDASLDVVVVDGVDAGRLYVARWPSEIRIMDFALLPEFRGRGVGTGLLRGLLAEGLERGLPVTIHVEQFNPARRLYERLGFVEAGEVGVYLLLRWTPPS